MKVDKKPTMAIKVEKIINNMLDEVEDMDIMNKQAVVKLASDFLSVYNKLNIKDLEADYFK